MSHRMPLWLIVLSVSSILSVPTVARGADMPHPTGQNIADMKFGVVPGLPTCAPGSLQSGDPTKGSFIILARIDSGCVIPWHWHSGNENLMLVSGVAKLDAKDEKTLTLRAGGFAMLPSRHVHQFTCASACKLYIYSDAAFDIHYLDQQGMEISAEDALKRVKETAAKPAM
jgi:quercetin dioxygenase-like cupin family protein